MGSPPPFAVPPTTVEVRDRVLWLSLQRPEVLNAIGHETVAGIHAALDRATEGDIRVVVIRGSGRAFCAGADLQDLPGATIDIDALEIAVSRVAEVVDRIAALPVPVIAGVNGIAAGGGLELVLASDLVIAVRGARLGDAHVNYGLLPGAGGSYRLPRRVGSSIARRMMLTGEFVPAEELVACGLISRVVAPEDLDRELTQLSSTLAGRSPRVLSAMKQLIASAAESTTAQAAEAERSALREHLRSGDVLEGLTAFREGRPPVFP